MKRLLGIAVLAACLAGCRVPQQTELDNLKQTMVQAINNHAKVINEDRAVLRQLVTDANSLRDEVAAMRTRVNALQGGE